MKRLTIDIILSFLFTFSPLVECSADDNYTAHYNIDEIESRIYGGTTAKLGQFPFQARLEIFTRSGVFVCGGSLISDQWILTAAHCIDGANRISVKLGVIDSRANTGQIRESRQFFQHSKWDSRNILNDIAVVKLANKVTLNSNVNIIQLPKKSQAPTGTFEGKVGVISGWGRSTNSQTRSVTYLQAANAKVMSHRSCERYYAKYIVGSGEICTSNAATRSGTCQGDSGGPLSIVENRTRILIGLTSWGVEQCQSNAPSVFTNVAAYLNFINYWTGISVS